MMDLARKLAAATNRKISEALAPAAPAEPPDTTMTNPVGWSSIYPPQVLTNPSPTVSPMLEMRDLPNMTQAQRFGLMLTRGRGRPALASDLPAAQGAGETFMDAGMAVAGATMPFKGMKGADLNSYLSNKFPGVDFHVDVSGKEPRVVLSKIVVPQDSRGQGIGTQFMDELIRYADENGKQLALTPSDSFGGNAKRLTQFYKRFGLKANSGRSRDFTTRETMVRDPK